MVISRLLQAAGLLGCLAQPAFAGSGGPTRIGHVDTTFRLLGRNDQIVVDRYDDPRVDGVKCGTCLVQRPGALRGRWA